jgi:hypothetical protein
MFLHQPRAGVNHQHEQRLDVVGTHGRRRFGLAIMAENAAGQG